MKASVYRSYGFWMSLCAAILLVVQTILHRFEIQIDQPFVQEIISAVLAVFVILGVISKPKAENTNNIIIEEADFENNDYENNDYLTDKTIDKEQ